MAGEDLEAIRKTFKRDRFASECTGAVVDVVDGDVAICSCDIADRHLNAGGNVMGGAIFSLADFAFAVATNHQGILTVTVSSTIEFIGTAKGKRLIATARPDKIGHSMCYYTIDVKDELNNLVAKLVSVGKRTSVSIS